jgi:ketosteroid isomerase-like protein
MTTEEIDVLLRGYEALCRGDVDTVLASVDPEIEWRPGEIAPEGGGVHRGIAGYRQFLESWRESFEGFRLEPELCLVKDDRVIVVARQRGEGRGSGVAIDVEVVHVWTIRDGVGTAWWGASTLEQALEEVGAERLGIVLHGYEAFNRGDIEGALDNLAEDVVWHTYLVPGPGGGTYRGHEGVRELWRDARNVFGEFRNEPERMIEAGDHVVALIRVCGRGKGSGIEVEASIAHLHMFEGGRVARVESYEDRGEALRQAGIT